MGTKTYDPDKVNFIYGPMPITGYAPGTFIKVTRNNDTFKVFVGSQGEAARARLRDRSGTIEITLLQTSPSNDFLSTMAALDEQFGTGVVPAMVKDQNGTTECLAAEAWVRKPAELEYGADIVGRTWVIETGRLEMFIGGNTI